MKNNKKNGLREFRENTKILLLDIEKDSSFIVVKKNKPIFKISPIDNEKWEEVIDFTKI